MNKRLLFIDIIILWLGIIMFSAVQLFMTFNPKLLSSAILLVSFAIFIIAFGTTIMILSYRNNTAKITLGNCFIHIVFGLIIYAFYSIPALEFAKYNGVSNSACIALVGIFISRFAFSCSKYIKSHNENKKVKTNKGVYFKPVYSRNMPDDLGETMNIIGFVVLIGCAVLLIYNTINPCFNIAFPY